MKSAKLAKRCVAHLVPASSRSSLSVFELASLNNLRGLLRYRSCHSVAAVSVQDVSRRDVFLAFKDWFRSTNIEFFDEIFKVLKEPDDYKEKTLSQMGFRVTEQLVLQVLSYGNRKYDVLSCIKFFDWAGRQPNFRHTRSTFHAVFRILSRAKLMPLMIEFLDSYEKQRFMYGRCEFRRTIIMGYALAGEIPIALQLFSKMRYCGLDLDSFVYNILLNVLIEEGYFEAANSILKQISMGKLEDKMTYSIIVKSLCKKKKFEEAESYLRRIGYGNENGRGLCVLVDSLCRDNQFEKAWELIEEFKESGTMSMHPSYCAWMKNLALSGEVDETLQFLAAKKIEEDFAPDAETFNCLLFILLKLNRVKAVFHLLMEMQEIGVSPNKSTMSAAFCFLCKVGMADIAVDLNECKSEFGLSPNGLAYSYLIDTLCAEGNPKEAWIVLHSSIKEGYLPQRSNFLNLAHALCREKMLDKMKEILLLAYEQNLSTCDAMMETFISELCRCRRVEDAYLFFSELNRMNRVAGQDTYSTLICGLCQSNRGDLAARLLVEMQDNGHSANRALFLTVISSLLKFPNPEAQVLMLLEKQVHRHGHNRHVYNYFIEGAGYGRNPELAEQVYKTMTSSGVTPNLQSEYLMLMTYFRNRRLSKALKYIDGLNSRGLLGKALCETAVVGLCELNRSDLALSLMNTMDDNGITFKSLCYEAVIHKLSQRKRYADVVNLVYELDFFGRRMTTFIGNVLIFHSMMGERLHETWTRFNAGEKVVPAKLQTLYKVISIFSSCSSVALPIDSLEEMIESCFPMNLYTYNMLLKRCSRTDAELAREVFDRMTERGFVPNKWSFQFVIAGFLRRGLAYDALRWLEEMEKRGFDQTHITNYRFMIK